MDSCDSDSAEEELMPRAKAKSSRKIFAKKGKKMAGRSRRRGDDVSECMYNLKKASPSAFM